jgi:hypothetical protein
MFRSGRGPPDRLGKPPGADQVTEVAGAVAGDHGMVDGTRGGRALQAEQRPELAEVPARAEHGQYLLTAVSPLADNLDPAVLDRVDEVAAVALLVNAGGPSSRHGFLAHVEENSNGYAVKRSHPDLWPI